MSGLVLTIQLLGYLILTHIHLPAARNDFSACPRRIYLFSVFRRNAYDGFGKDKITHTHICIYIYIHIIPVVPHKAVAEVSKIRNL